MYAIVEISGKQFKVAKSDVVKIPLQNAAPKDKLKFSNVLLVDDKGKVTIGTPFVKNATVSATVVEHGRDRKIIVFKKKRRKDYEVKRGHRQAYTMINIDSITVAKAKETAPKVATEKAPATKVAPKVATEKAPATKAAPKVATEKAPTTKAAPKVATEKAPATKAAPKKVEPKKSETVKKTEKE
ncbi:MAG: 50S ribosomal protein L21 [Candidatus Neomarinimicrobiota bacterium]